MAEVFDLESIVRLVIPFQLEHGGYIADFYCY